MVQNAIAENTAAEVAVAEAPVSEDPITNAQVVSRGRGTQPTNEANISPTQEDDILVQDTTQSENSRSNRKAKVCVMSRHIEMFDSRWALLDGWCNTKR